MFDRIFHRLIKDPENTQDQKVRTAYGTLGSATGIILNLLLSGIKALVGTMTGSVAVVADAANNLSDAGGSIMALVSTKMAQKPRDAEHPFGHGRYEYIGSLGVGALIILMGVELLKSGVESIISPAPVAFSYLSLGLMLLSICAKLWMWAFYNRIGQKVDNSTMLAAGKDSISDVMATSGVVISMLVTAFIGWPIDGIMGVVVALLVLKTGWDVLSDTVSRLLGGKPDKELGKKIIDKLLSYDGILGVHDFVLHDYGPGRCMASVHAEVSAHSDIVEIHEVIDKAEREISDELGIPICIHMDPVLTGDEAEKTVRGKLADYLAAYHPPLKLHDFRCVPGENRVNLIFDILVPPEFQNEGNLKKDVQAYAVTLDPKYCCVIHVDRDFFTE